MGFMWWQSDGNSRAWRDVSSRPDARAFHATMPGYAPTPLTGLPRIAFELGVRQILVKDESSRMGLPAFKVLGVSWALARALAVRGGTPTPTTFHDLVSLAGRLAPLELVTATDGNHGRALAHLSARIGLASRIFVPSDVNQAAVDAIAGEGATVERVSGGYDEAVAQAAGYARASAGRMLIQDTAWPGYEEIPAWIVDGYDTLFAEVDEQVDVVDLVVVPTGVGSLLQSAVAHFRCGDRVNPPAMLAVEPEHAACMLASLRSGQVGTIPTTHTVMAGLNCGTPSMLAWPIVAAGLDAAIAVPDDAALDAMRDLRALGIDAGPCGASSLAGLRLTLTGAGADRRRDALGITGESTIVLVSTDGRASGAG